MDSSVRQAICSDCLQYRIDSGGCAIITSCTSSAATLAIPSHLDDYPVTEIGNSAFARMYSLERILLPNGLLRIGDYAFKGCTKLREVDFPGTLQSIGREAFFATAIERFDIPASCIDVHDDAFVLQGIWQNASNSIRASTLKGISVNPENAVLTMKGEVLCERRPEGLRALLCPAACDAVDLSSPISSVSVSAFTGVGSIDSIRISEGLRCVGRGIVFPHTSCRILAFSRLGENDLVFHMPSAEVAQDVLSSLFHQMRASAASAANAFDRSIATLPDELERSKVMLARLEDGRYLTEQTRSRFGAWIRESLDSICLHYGASGYWKGFEQLIDCGLLEATTVTHVIDLLAKHNDAAAVAFVLNAQRKRTQRKAHDYDI